MAAPGCHTTGPVASPRPSRARFGYHYMIFVVFLCRKILPPISLGPLADGGDYIDRTQRGLCRTAQDWLMGLESMRPCSEGLI